MYRLAFLALTGFCVQARADVITYSLHSTLDGVATGRHADFNGSLNVPMFDPTLGTLDSIQFQIIVSGQLYWQVISPNVASMQSWEFVNGVQATFLGITDTVRPLGTQGGTGPCEVIAWPEPCGRTLLGSSGFSNDAPDFQGAITSSGTSASPLAYGNSVSGISTALPSDFTGNGSVLLPVTASADGYQSFDYLVFGDLLAQQTGVGARLEWSYLYTPVPQVLPPNVSETPEPGTLGVCALIFAALAFKRARNSYRASVLAE